MLIFYPNEKQVGGQQFVATNKCKTQKFIKIVLSCKKVVKPLVCRLLNCNWIGLLRCELGVPKTCLESVRFRLRFRLRFSTLWSHFQILWYNSSVSSMAVKGLCYWKGNRLNISFIFKSNFKTAQQKQLDLSQSSINRKARSSSAS